MAKTEKYTAEEVAEAVHKTKGLLTQTARHLRVTLQTIYNYRDRHEVVRKAIRDARESLKDFTEGKLVEQINDGNTTAIIFYLKTQAKDRGYTEKVETAHSGEIRTGISFEEAIELLKQQDG